MLHCGVSGGKVLTQCAVGFDTDLARKRGAGVGRVWGGEGGGWIPIGGGAERYATIVKIITYRIELPTLAKLTEMLVEEERQLATADEGNTVPGRRSATAFAVQTNRGQPGKPPRKCWVCDKVGHVALHCPEATCYGCGKRGHMVRNCPKKQTAHASVAIAF